MSANTTSTKHPRWTLAIVSIALFMTALDNLVVGVALPSIRVDLGGSIELLEWTVNAYTLTFAVLLITGAALGDRFGRKRMFVIGLGIFTGASALAALAPTIEALDRRPCAAGPRSGDRPAAHADAALRSRARREARDGARHLGRRQRPRRRARPVRRRRRRRGHRLAVDLLAQRPHRPRAAAARRAPPDRVARPLQAARPARSRARRCRPLRPDLRHRAGHRAGLDVGDRRSSRSAAAWRCSPRSCGGRRAHRPRCCRCGSSARGRSRPPTASRSRCSSASSGRSSCSRSSSRPPRATRPSRPACARCRGRSCRCSSRRSPACSATGSARGRSWSPAWRCSRSRCSGWRRSPRRTPPTPA